MEKRVEQLEKKLAEKEDELLRYSTEIAKLNTQLRDLIQQISLEIKMAHVIQKTLVPTEIPNIPGFEFSTKFIASFVSGGDYFDIFEHDDRFRFGMILSCSSGHGMSALFLSVLMKLAGSIEARKGAGPANAILSMAKELIPNIQTSDSADVFYGVMDRSTYEMEYTLAGDVVALHFTNAENGIVRLRSHSPSLSSEFVMELQSEKISLNARDRLVIVSKGVVESPNAKGEPFGVKRVEDCIFSKKGTSVHELRNEILYQVEKFTGKSEPDRDQTVMIMEVKDKVIKLARN